MRPKTLISENYCNEQFCFCSQQFPAGTARNKNEDEKQQEKTQKEAKPDHIHDSLQVLSF